MYGKTYGKTSFTSAEGTFPRGIDLPNHVKYASTAADEMVNHSQRTVATTAEIVGVKRGGECYKKVS
jgi:hypothetical protein